jgi:hypothetical protein
MLNIVHFARGSKADVMELALVYLLLILKKGTESRKMYCVTLSSEFQNSSPFV